MANDVVVSDEVILDQIRQLSEAGEKVTPYRLKRMNDNRGREDRYRKLIEFYQNNKGELPTRTIPNQSTTRPTAKLPQRVLVHLDKIASDSHEQLLQLAIQLYHQLNDATKAPLDAAIQAKQELEQRIEELEQERQIEREEFNDELVKQSDYLEDERNAIARAHEKIAQLQNSLTTNEKTIEKMAFTASQDTKTNESLIAARQALIEKLSERNQRVTTLETQLNNATEATTELKKKNAEVAEQLQEASQQLATVSESARQRAEQNDALKAGIEALQKQYDAASQKVARLEGQMGSCQERLADATDTNKILSEQVSQAQQAHAKTSGNLERAEQLIKQLTERQT